ncbi:MAG: hypothetical protein IT427_11115 [Pirellulales bacterium]|nr:hypothetical protein [Pirellulales bacterium]
MASWLASREAHFAANVSEALHRIERGFTPTIIVVAPPWPGHFSARSIAALRHAAPLARIASVLGAWLEGETRTGKPWPAVWRTYWHQWMPRLATELDRLAAGEAAAWSLPPTSSEGERLLQVNFPAKQAKPIGSSAKAIAIISTSRETAESLGDVCRDRGWKSIWLQRPTDASPGAMDLVIFDFSSLVESEVSKIANYKTQWAMIPLIALVSFPRIADVELLKSHRVAAVVSKPFLNHELVWQIDQLLAKPTNSRLHAR